MDGTTTERLAIAAVGLNLWAVWVAIPIWMGEPRERWHWGISILPLLFLAPGVRWLQPWLLYVAYPASCAVLVASMSGMVLGIAHPPVALFVGALSTLAYGAVVAQAVSRPAFENVTTKPLEGVPEDPAGRRRLRVRRLMLALSGVGALALAVLAPTLGGPAALTRAWGTAANEAEVLAAVVGGALATLSLVAFVGPATRKRRHLPSIRRRRTRVALLLMVVFVGFFVWLNVQRYS